MQRRTEFAGGEVVEGAKASGEFCGVQVALAVEAAEKIIGRLFSFLRIAFDAARDQVAVGIAPRPRPRPGAPGSAFVPAGFDFFQNS